ncbi:MAG: DinB family protein [Anaerolineaceae bacterium]|nr:DinB family protein [Anaerolineaceae bacterium]
MITKEDFKDLFSTWGRILDMQTKDLSQEDLLIQPQPGGNCMLWVLGHMVNSLSEMLIELGVPAPAVALTYERFASGSEPVLGAEEGLPSLEKIKEDFATISKLAIQALDEQSEEFFAEEAGHGQTNGGSLLFSSFHLSYHSGQLEYLRNLAGKTEKVI